MHLRGRASCDACVSPLAAVNVSHPSVRHVSSQMETSTTVSQQLADLPDEDTCSICYGICYHPARISKECSHTFCRMCVFRTVSSGSAFASVSCPLCRAPMDAAHDEVLVPSHIPYDSQQGSTLAARHSDLYQAALGREAEIEGKLLQTLIPKVPLIMAPGSCARDGQGTPIRPKCKAPMTLIFTDPDALKTLGTHRGEQVRGPQATSERRAPQMHPEDYRRPPPPGAPRAERARARARPVSGWDHLSRGVGARRRPAWLPRPAGDQPARLLSEEPPAA